MTDLNIQHKFLKKGYLDYDHLIGREFIHGQLDCYDILVSFFKDNFNITLTNYARPDDWWINGMDLYRENFRNEGFQPILGERLEDLRVADVFLMCLPDPRDAMKTVINHCGIYVGNGKMLHHRLGKRSQVITYAGLYKNFTSEVIRHKEVPNLTAVKPKNVDLMDYILPSKRDLLMGALNDKNKS